MDTNTPYDDWSRHIHAVITFLKPYFDDWRSYVSLVSVFLGIGVLVMENQVLLRMRMGRWEIIGYVVSLLPAPVAKNYRIMGGVCIAASVLTLTSNVLYMLRGWEKPSQFFDWSSGAVRWLTSQIWYAIGMIFLFHVVTRPAQSGVVFFGKFPRDLWAQKWYLCILYIPVHYMLLELCDIHRDTKEILIPLEILVDIMLYNGPFLLILLRILYLAWKVAYDEAVLTGAIFEDGSEGANPLDGRFTGRRRGGSAADCDSGGRSGRDGYVGLAMVDLDEAERGQVGGEHVMDDENGSLKKTRITGSEGQDPDGEDINEFVLEDNEDDDRLLASTSISPGLRRSVGSPARGVSNQSPLVGSPAVRSSPAAKSAMIGTKAHMKKSVMFDVDMTDEGEDNNEDDDDNNRDDRNLRHGGRQEEQRLV
ncbi:hypothetical protein EDD11_009905 [Mortierella claussenii]|nr:hypothetical protein EDD11_009905 [Mortierella claussenii]